MNQRANMQLQNIGIVDRVAYFIATGFGAGLMPKAPGTFGALESVMVFIIAFAFHLSSSTLVVLFATLSAISFAIGVWASSRVCRATGIDDPSQIVVDEICGQFIALVPVAFAPTVLGLISAFVLFRLFDIFKPYPIRKLEQFHGGLGVMADDALAGLYAAAL